MEVVYKTKTIDMPKSEVLSIYDNHVKILEELKRVGEITMGDLASLEVCKNRIRQIKDLEDANQ
jgi:hypothetical protein